MTTFSQNFNSLVKVTLIDEQQQIKIETENKTNDETIVDMDEQAKSQDFFQDNNAIGKKYTTTCIKSIFFQILPTLVLAEDYYNKNFIFDVYLPLTKNLNPFSLDRKLADKTKHEMIYM